MTCCYSNERDVKKFMATVRANPDLVFLRGRWQGRLVDLTLSTFLEGTHEVVVIGPKETWRVHIERERGKGLIVRNTRLPQTHPARTTGFASRNAHR